MTPLRFHISQGANEGQAAEARGQLIPAATNLSLGASSVPAERPVEAGWRTRYDAGSGMLLFDVGTTRNGDARVEVYSTLGERVASVPVGMGSGAVSIGMLPSGSYMAWLTAGGNVVGVSRIGVTR